MEGRSRTMVELLKSAELSVGRGVSRFSAPLTQHFWWPEPQG